MSTRKPLRGETTITITTPQFRAGQSAAQSDARKGSSGPSAMLNRAPAEFAAGYRYEWREFIAPTR